MTCSIHVQKQLSNIKAHTHRPIFREIAAESVVESADSGIDSTTDSVIVGHLSILNMFNILNPPESADGSRLTIGVGQSCKLP